MAATSISRRFYGVRVVVDCRQAKRSGGSENQSRRFMGAWRYVCCTTAFFLLPSCGSLYS
nr:hypothetical protein [Dialister invisus]